MSPKLLPIGIPTFRKIIEGDFLYVDKTEMIYELVNNPGGIYFLSRPRRFGKSLLISTLSELFRGNRELFRGLWIDSAAYDWETYPVLHLDFNLYRIHSVAELETSVKYFLNQTATEHGLMLTDTLYFIQFAELISGLAKKYGKQVVVLIDEYDKPLIDNLTNLEESKHIRDFLKGFYRVLKSMDAQLRFLLLTGISKFSKVGVFSDLNNLFDISMLDRYAALPGITQAEVEHYFAERIETFAAKKSLPHAELLEQIRYWYNGFAFSKATLGTYNPFSLLQLFETESFSNYWFESGTPTFLVNLIATGKYTVQELTQLKVEEIAFSTYELENLAIVPLLFQTGYLTIKGYDESRRVYTLGHPNFEVENAFQVYLLGAFSQIEPSLSTSYLWQLIDALHEANLTTFFEVLQIFFAQIPYTIQLPREKYYQSIFFLLFKLIGLRAAAEVTTNQGRIDAVVELDNTIYLFEFKLNGSAESALAQIKATHYYQQYQGRNKPLHLVGVNFSTRKRGLSNWKEEIL